MQDKQHVCPVWVGHLLASPLRRIVENPDRILEPCLKPGATALDVGCAMGFFSLPAARLVGPSGRVICVDCQEKMLTRLMTRARKADLASRIVPHVCGTGSLGLEAYEGQVDFALAMMVVHEVPDAARFFEEVWNTLKPGASMWVAEPKGHVSQAAFDKTLDVAKAAGFRVGNPPAHQPRGRSALLEKTGQIRKPIA